MFNQQAIASTFLLFFLLFCMVGCLEIGNHCRSWVTTVLWWLAALGAFSLMVSHIVYLFVGA